jgi:hypothetical protein
LTILIVSIVVAVQRGTGVIRGLSGRGGRGDRGEGVISMGVAVLITAVIGALMFVGLKLFWEDISSTVSRWIDSIGG